MMSLKKLNNKVQSLNMEAISLGCAQDFQGAYQLLEQAISLAPSHAVTYHNLGSIQLMDGSSKALETFEIALRLDPKSEKTHFNLANLFRKIGKTEKAIIHLEHVINLNPNHHSAPYILATLTGKAEEHSPRDFIVKLFDQYASTFDEVLLGELVYKAPKLLKALLVESMAPESFFEHAIDLGCGTGLAAMELRSFVQKLDGVDLSPKMIEKADEKGVYDQLSVAEIVEFLNNSKNRYDLFVASDTFVYIGNLEPVFQAIANCASPNAIILFSIERTDDVDYKLMDTGRFAHSVNYIKDIASSNSMTVISHQTGPLRRDSGKWISGEFLLLKMNP